MELTAHDLGALVASMAEGNMPLEWACGNVRAFYESLAGRGVVDADGKIMGVPAVHDPTLKSRQVFLRVKWSD